MNEYEARALTTALNRLSESDIRWLPDYLDRLERDIEEYRQLVERQEAANAAPREGTEP